VVVVNNNVFVHHPFQKF